MTVRMDGWMDGKGRIGKGRIGMMIGKGGIGMIGKGKIFRMEGRILNGEGVHAWDG